MTFGKEMFSRHGLFHLIDFAKRHFHFLAILQPVALSMPNVKVRRGSALPKLQDLPQLQDKYRRKSYPYLEKQRQTVNDDHQREAERTRVMEDIQFKNALLMNGILGEAIEFELARQFDVTLAPEVAESWTKTSLNQKDPENLNVDQKDEQGKLVKTVKGMSCLGLEISFVSVESFSAKDSGVSDLTVAATRRLSDLVIHDGQDFEVMSVEEENLMIEYFTTMHRVPVPPKNC